MLSSFSVSHRGNGDGNRNRFLLLSNLRFEPRVLFTDTLLAARKLDSAMAAPQIALTVPVIYKLALLPLLGFLV